MPPVTSCHMAWAAVQDLLILQKLHRFQQVPRPVRGGVHLHAASWVHLLRLTGCRQSLGMELRRLLRVGPRQRERFQSLQASPSSMAHQCSDRCDRTVHNGNMQTTSSSTNRMRPNRRGGSGIRLRAQRIAYYRHRHCLWPAS